MKDVTSKYFNQKVFTMGIRKPEDKIEFSFPFLGEEKDILFIRKGCGCTDAYYDMEENKVKGEIDLSRAQTYKDGEAAPVNKYVTIVMNDGRDEQVADEKKRGVPNLDKEYCRLQLSAIVQA